MSVLFMMPQWDSASEGWMQRMLLGIASDLSVIVVNDANGSRTWREATPVVSLGTLPRQIRYLSRLASSMGLMLERAARPGDRVLRDTLRRFGVSRILCQYGTFAVDYMRVWRNSEVPLFVHFHGYDATFDLRKAVQPDERRFPRDYLEQVRELAGRALFITSSEFTKSLLVNAGVPSDRVKVKYCGVPVTPQARRHTQTAGMHILHLGRLVDFKSPDRTIQAFELARSNGMDGRLTIAGDGALRATCELLKARSPYRDLIDLTGTVPADKAQALLSEADILTQHNVVGEVTGQAEGLGVSILEAMAAGLPVVGTKSGGVLETVIDGETGILVDPGDVEAQAEAFLKLAREPELRQQMGNAGRTRVTEFFSPELEARRLREIMDLSAPL